MDPWLRYASWNKDVADAVYPRLPYAREVFLDLEGDALNLLADLRSAPRDTLVESLLDAVQPLLGRQSQTAAFERFDRRLAQWNRGDQFDPPPVVGVLAVFALAAQRMTQGGGFAAHNYHGRLAELLQLDTVVVSNSYRKVATKFWGALSDWLRLRGGTRGLPIDFVLGKQLPIGRSLAQALLRDTDRRRLEGFFQDFDLPPRSDLDPDQIRPLLEAWITRTGRPNKHFRYLWSEKSARDPLCQAVSGVLRTWGGDLSVAGGDAGPAGRIRLSLMNQRLRRRILIAPVLSVPRSHEERQATLVTAGGPVPITLTQRREGEMGIGDIGALLDEAALLEGVLTIEDPVAGRLERRPRAVVVLREDEATGTWLEITQVRLGESVQLLVRDGVDIAPVLADISGTGWTVVEPAEIGGLPSGWKLVRGVTVIDRPSRQLSEVDDLAALVPLTTSTFALSGGLRLLPRRAETYHRLAPPTITAASDGDGFTVTLVDLDQGENSIVDQWTSNEGRPLVIDLSADPLLAGQYRATLEVLGSPTKSRAFVLADSSTNLERQFASVGHGATDPLMALAADDIGDAEAAVMGVAHVPAPDDQRPRRPIPSSPWWGPSPRVQTAGASTLTLVKPSPDSCHFTPAHHIEVETVMPDKYLNYNGTSRGVCRGCGRISKFQNNFYVNRRAWERKRAAGERAPATSAGSAPATHRDLGTAVDWDLLLEAVITLGGGERNDLERLARQVDPTAGFAREMIATLAALGHIEIVRDPQTLELLRWETVYTSVIVDGDGDGQHRLVGHWGQDHWEAMACEGIDISVEAQVGAPSSRSTQSSLDAVAAVIPGVVVVEQPGHELLNLLPPLSAVIEALPTIPRPAVLNVDVFDPASATWVPASHSEAAGAYRTVGYSRNYFIRTHDDVATGSARRVTVDLAKHATHLLAGSGAPLVAYDEKSEELVVPLGAPLPGLYRRAVTVASGRVPVRRDVSRHGSIEVYPAIDRSLADRLYHLLEN